MMTRKWFKGLNRIQRSAVTAGAVAVLAGAAWGSQLGMAQWRLRQAETHLGRGFQTLAAETLDPWRKWLSSNQRGCEALVAAYYGAHRPDRLEWAAQACITAGVETTDVYISLAAARELTGRDGDALQMLQQIARKFPKSPDPFYHMAQIMRRNKKDTEAADLLYRASTIAPASDQLAMEALEALSQVKRWTEAKGLADRLKSVETDNVEVKLVIARALINGNDPDTARTQIAQARKLMEKNPEAKAALESSYADVFKVEAGGPAVEGSRNLASPDQGHAGGEKIHPAHPPLSPATPPRTF